MLATQVFLSSYTPLYIYTVITGKKNLKEQVLDRMLRKSTKYLEGPGRERLDLAMGTSDTLRLGTAMYVATLNTLSWHAHSKWEAWSSMEDQLKEENGRQLLIAASVGA